MTVKKKHISMDNLQLGSKIKCFDCRESEIDAIINILLGQLIFES